MKLARASIAAGLMVLLATTAAARDLLVIVENRNYRALPDVSTVLDRRAIQRSAREVGFDILQLTDATGVRMQGRFSERMAELLAADRLVVVLAGHIVGDGDAHWLLGVDAPQRSDPFRVQAGGLRIDAILNVLATKPGAGMLFVVPAAGLDVAGPRLIPGYQSGDVPQGVTVVSGPADGISLVLSEDVLPGRVSVGRAIDERGLQGAGFLPRADALLGAPDPEVIAEAEAWRQATETDSIAAYEEFIGANPDSRFRSDAELRLAALRARPEVIERDLGLSRDARRQAQENLTVLGFDTRGVDGIFGGGSRSAIRGWQQAEGFPVTGYLTGNQVTRLQETAAVRRDQLAEEAEQQDRSFWRQTGRGETEEGVRRYLGRYPDGLFAPEARDALRQFEGDRAEADRLADQSAWELARGTDTVASYEQYLQTQPNGAYRDEAERRLEAVRGTQASSGAIARARQDESQIANPITRLLVERRLAQLGLQPGVTDGQFDNATRQALRKYQRDRGLVVTGYVSQETLLRLLAGN